MGKSIDKVTTTNLDLAFRMVGIECDRDTTDRIIDIVELLEKKGDKTTMKDICNLKAEWNGEYKTIRVKVGSIVIPPEQSIQHGVEQIKQQYEATK
jgi:hypothetical protein